MCGIIGYLGTPAPLSVIVNGLRRLEYRGYDSSGIAYVESAGGFQIHKAAGKLSNLVARLPAAEPAIQTAIGHTRWATHGAANDTNAHPHAGPTGCIVLAHNGIIENHHGLRQSLPSSVFQSATDTEVLAHWIEQATAGQTDFTAALHKALEPVEGAYALAIMSRNHPGQLFATRRQVPLLIGLATADDGQVSYMIASDTSALPDTVSEVIYLQDSEIAALSHQGLRLLDKTGMPTRHIVQPYQPSRETADKGDYPHYMLKEIYEQPAIVQRVLDNWVVSDGLKQALSAARRVIVLGCGTSLNASLVGRHLIESWAGIPAMVESAGEFRYRRPALQSGDLTILLSQSGETADTLAALRLARLHGIPTIAVTNRPTSSLAREADLTIPLLAGVEVSVAATKSFTAQVLVLTLLAQELSRSRGAPKAIEAELRNLPTQLEDLLADPVPYQMAARQYTTARSAFFMARGINTPIALEGALKLKEVSYIHAEGYASGELKHGPLALLDSQLPVIVLLAEGSVLDKTLSNCQEAQARGAPVIAITTTPLSAALSAQFAQTIILPKCSEDVSPIPLAVATQLLAYYVALELKRDIDQPRNIAKSVTVE